MNKQLTNADKQVLTWEPRFQRNHHLWGIDPSITVTLLRSALDELFEGSDVVKNIVTVGAGTFRDEVHLAANGAEVKGFELTESGVRLGEALAEAAGVKKRINFQQQSFAKSKSKETFDALLSHRTLHLLDDKEVKAFVKKSAQWVKPGGLMAVSARNFSDFDPDDMRWISEEEGIAEYTTADREGHIVRFWDEARFRSEFGEDFDLSTVTFLNRTEMESSTNAEKKAHFTIMLAQRKAEFNIVAAGNVTVETKKLDLGSAAAASAAAVMMVPQMLGQTPLLMPRR